MDKNCNIQYIAMLLSAIVCNKNPSIDCLLYRLAEKGINNRYVYVNLDENKVEYNDYEIIARNDTYTYNGIDYSLDQLMSVLKI